MYSYNGEATCILYDINDAIDNDKVYEKKCITNFYGFKVYYFPEKDEYGFSCIT